MIKPNWEIFRAKFSGDSQHSFEWFCYLLFCKEFDYPYGIFRFKNQHALETDPIKIDSDVIGWQAKFYDTPLSSHKADLLKTIKDAKKKYTNITKLHLYTNKEWSQTSKGNDTVAFKAITQTAADLNIKLVWRTASYFESEFVSVKNEVFSKHFFSLDKDIFDLITEQQKHTESILKQIQTYISFNNQDIEIDRNENLEKLKDKSQKISIISGAGGVGKTVLSKRLHEQLGEEIPFYVFKATEFELKHINDLFTDYSCYDFFSAHENEKNKFIVIDSSEKLLDLKNADPFKEFLSILVDNEWNVIFTTRDNYVEDLNYQFFEIYEIAPLNIRINNLELEELSVISSQYGFSLPKDEKLQELIRNPFYLNEYLRFYKVEEDLKYTDFKNTLWNKNIKKSQPKREQCFLQIALERANSGQFFISSSYETEILDKELVRDGILGYETAGYFITHDIYEEWALEKSIEIEFIKNSTSLEFFAQIGQSLPIRRSFRNWLSEKLLLNDNNIKVFIEEVIDNEEIEPFWRDELLVSVLHSNYSKTYFDIFKNELLADDQNLLKKLTFILRITCKEVDDNLLQLLGARKLNLFSLEYILTKPKGQGWESLIQFVFDNIEAIGIKNINFVLPVIHDWNNKVKEGKTTRISSLIALQFYQWIIAEDIYYSRDKTKENLFQTIIYGASEIKDELKDILEEILINKWKNHRDPYYDLSEVILTKLEGIAVSKVLPEYVLKLADLFWSYTPQKVSPYHSSRREGEQYFGLEPNYSKYHPASAFQTPIYWLLQFHLKQTIDFILDFTNKAVHKYADSGFDDSVQEVKVFFEDKVEKNQYINNCLWNMYRGTTGSSVSPDLLQSIHMAVEKRFLEIGKDAKSSVLESWLLYLLKHTESASISSVVASVVLAYPEKTFNVANVLFQTKEFISHDTSRFIYDQSAKSLYSIGRNMGSRVNDFYDGERIKTCEDKHRKWTLENLFLNYQCFANEEIGESEAAHRQKALWRTLDNYYTELPQESEQTEQDKIWRLFLARMDKRKMNITTEETDEGVAIHFNPDLESGLKEFSETSLAKNSESMKYSSLKIWADYKFALDNRCKQYEQYENDIKHALREANNIVAKLEEINGPDYSVTEHPEDENFFLFNQSIPAYVCSVVLRDHNENLTADEKSFCRDIILAVSSSSIQPNYRYQISDGVQQAISVLPVLLEVFPEEKENIKIILLLSLFNDSHVGGMLSSEKFSIFPIIAIQKLWEINFDDAQSLLLGYLLLRPQYDVLRDTIREENYDNDIHEYSHEQLLKRFFEDCEEALQKVVDNKLTPSNIQSMNEYDLFILNTALQMLPKNTDNDDHKTIAKVIISTSANKMVVDDRKDKIDYMVKHDFLQTYTYFVLNSPTKEVQGYIKPFLDNFNSSEFIADLFQEFVLSQDSLNRYDNFWLVWNSFKEKVFEICEKGDRHRYTAKIVKSYLFAQVPWKETAKEWHSLKNKDKKFFKELSKNIGHCSSVLYAISKLLNDIGSIYIDDGIVWISNILRNNQRLEIEKLEDNTIYYMEHLVRKYTYENRERIKTTKVTKDNILVILNYLIGKGSVSAYMLRENII